MVRPVQNLSYIEEEVSRQACFSKRRNGLLKKAFEISVLCDVDTALIAFSPTGRLNHFASSNRIEDILIDFINLHEDIREYPIENPESLVQSLNQSKQETEEADQDNAHYFSGIKQELNRVKEQIRIAEDRLKEYEPDPESVTSTDEAEAREAFIQDTLNRLMERKMELLQNPNLQTSPQQPIPVQLNSERNDGFGGGSKPLSNDANCQANIYELLSQNESTTVNQPSHQNNDQSSLDKAIDSEGSPATTQKEAANYTSCALNTECFDLLNSYTPAQWEQYMSTPLSTLPTIDTPPPNPPPTAALDSHDEGLSSFDPEDDNLVVPDYQNGDKNVAESEPLISTRPSAGGVFDISEYFPVGLSNSPAKFQAVSSSTTTSNPPAASYPAPTAVQQQEFDPRNGVGPSITPEQVNWVPKNNQLFQSEQNSNFNIQSEPFIPSRSLENNIFMGINQATGLAAGGQPGDSLNMPLQPDHQSGFSMAPGHFVTQMEPPFNQNQINQMGFMVPNLPSEGTSTGLGKRKLSSRAGNMVELDEVNRFCQPQAQVHAQARQGQNVNLLEPATNPPRSGALPGIYDPAYERLGLPIDPHFRSFRRWPPRNFRS